MRRSKPRPPFGDNFAFRAEEFVRVAGPPAGFRVEVDRDPLRIDHVWITILAGRFGRLRIDINTYSLRHVADGFDPRLRVGLISAPWTQLPASGVVAVSGLDYAELERVTPVLYRETERVDLEELLRVKTERALCIEAWGAIYLRDRLGIHQVHSRRASCSVPTEYIGRDGAIRFYFPESLAETVLFKYCGQV